MKFITPKSFKINNDFWFESHFYPMPEETRNSIRYLMNQIDLRKLASHKMAGVDESQLGLIVVEGNEFLVYIGNFRSARYNVKRGVIEIPYGTLNPDEILEQLEHEVGHVLDKKIKSKTWRGTNIDKELQTDIERSNYFKEPVEFDAIGSSYDAYIKRTFNDLSLQEKQVMIDRFNNWLRFGGEVPYFNQEITDRWKTKPTLWRKFQQRVFNLVQDLVDNLAKVL